MPDQPPQHRKMPIVRGREVEAALLMRDMSLNLRSVSNESVRRALDNVRAVAVAMANIQNDPNRWTTTGESLLAHLDNPTSGHLVATMALHMSHYPANAVGALHILEHAGSYIHYIAQHTKT